MSAESNKAVIRRWFEEVFSRGDLATLDQIFSADYVSHDPGPTGAGWPRGPEAGKAIASTYRGAFPDLHFMIDDQITEGDKVVTRWTARGTNSGSLLGAPPTGKTATVTGIEIDRIVDNKILETWVNFDLLGMLQQLGMIPAPGQAS